MESRFSKQELRKELLLQRKELRDRTNGQSVLTLVLPHLPTGLILSYASFSSEIPTYAINSYLLETKRLVLPRMEGDDLIPTLSTGSPLHINKWGVREPDAGQVVKPEEIAAILVPGIAFDTQGYRLGYGKGHYDRFLQQTNIPTIGLTYKELFFEMLLPRDPWDIPMKRVLSI